MIFCIFCAWISGISCKNRLIRIYVSIKLPQIAPFSTHFWPGSSIRKLVYCFDIFVRMFNLLLTIFQYICLVPNMSHCWTMLWSKKRWPTDWLPFIYMITIGSEGVCEPLTSGFWSKILNPCICEVASSNEPS